MKRDLTRQANEFKLVNNLIILPQGAGLRNKPGNTAFNSALSGAPIIQGLGYFNVPGSNSFIVAVAGGKIWRSTVSGASFSDVTGAVTATTGRDNVWQLVQFNNKIIGIGGAPNAPWTLDTTGNAALLGGTPPTTGTFGFSHANRMFIGKSDIIYYSVLSNAGDWTGVGSGNVTVDLGDGSDLVGAAELDTNNTLIFKQTSVHLMTGRSDPFPTFKLFDNVGLAGKNAVVVADGLAYWITPDAQMAITDGQTLIDLRKLPRIRNAADELKAIPVARRPYICGARYRGVDFDWIVWAVNKNDTSLNNDYAIIWDLNNQCFLTAKTGFNANCMAITPQGTFYMGGYDGIVYQALVEDTYTEASNSGAAVTWNLQSDALNIQSLAKIVQVNDMGIALEANDSINITLNYGYDDAGTAASVTFTSSFPGDTWDNYNWDEMIWTGIKAAFKNVRPLGRGNYFRYELTGSSTVDTRISGIMLRGRQQGVKNFEVR